jgi:hypothetical protein
MRVTREMIDAAWRGEYERGRTDWRPHVPTPEAVIRAMLEAAMKVLEPPAEPAPEPGPTNAKPTKPRPARLIVTASKPRPWNGSTGSTIDVS